MVGARTLGVALAVALLSTVCGPGLSGSALENSASDLVPSAPAATACDPGVTHYIPDIPYAITQLGMEQAWTLSTGAGVVVAVVDSGVSGDNAHLSSDGASPALLPGIDLVASGDGRQDTYGHGTEVAGEIAARPVEGSGLVGFAPDAQILPVRVYASTSDDDQKAGRGPTPDRIGQGIEWAADQGAAVIVVALSTDEDVPVLRDAVAYAESHGSLIVASAGNVSDDPNAPVDQPRYPAGYPTVIGVGSLDAYGLASANSVAGPHVSLAAPGLSVITTYFGAGDCMVSTDNPSTSFATGYVAGIAALVAAKHPDETVADWRYRLLETASRPVAQERDDAIGWGIVSPAAALSFINDGSGVGPDNPRYPDTGHPAEVPVLEPTFVASMPASVKLAVGIVFLASVVILACGVLAVRILRKREVRH